MIALGQQAIISMTSHIVFIIITWYALQGLHIESIIRKGRVFEARLLLILLTIAIGSTVSNFFLDLLFWSRQTPYLFS
ncbi:DUF1146 family protein [Bacillus alveayuensis]|jgi:uncharacterized integral membrane protein (TIGR02327 family)|uniref:DUF1146 family protein n=1 Tax=Aeribacillus alveayuensis TaxID=279215 RepID=UPI0005D0F55D|nr:DUF1146 family protein [Bacillus alveayuensis]